MSQIREIVPRQLRFAAAYLLFVVGAFLFSWFVLLPFSLISGDVQRRRYLAARAMRGYLSLLQALGLFLLRVENQPPQGAHVVVFNHPTIFDALVVLVQQPSACCVVKPRVFDSWGYGLSCRLLGYIPANSGVEVVQRGKDELAKGHSVILFPSGTRGELVEKLHRSAARLALEGRVPVVVGVLRCSPPVLGKGASWRDAPDRLVRMELNYLRPIALRPDARPLGIQSRELNSKIERVFQKELVAACL